MNEKCLNKANKTVSTSVTSSVNKAETSNSNKGSENRVRNFLPDKINFSFTFPSTAELYIQQHGNISFIFIYLFILHLS